MVHWLTDNVFVMVSVILCVSSCIDGCLLFDEAEIASHDDARQSYRVFLLSATEAETFSVVVSHYDNG